MSSDSADSSTSQSSNTFEVSDDEVNLVYNAFSAEMMKTYHGVTVGLNRNFRRRKRTNFAEWSEAAKVVKLCHDNGFNLKCYVKYCFLARLVPHGRGRSLRDVSFLGHYQQLSAYGSRKDAIERMYRIYMNILRSVLRIKDFHRSSGKSVTAILKEVVSEGKLFDYVSSGVLSRHFLALIPNIGNFVHEQTARRRNTDSNVVWDFYCTLGKYREDAMEAMRTFWPTGLKGSIIELCT